MTRLNQIIAVSKGAQATYDDAITKAHHTMQKPELFAGIDRTYSPVEDGGEQFPPESTKVQYHAEDLMAGVANVWTRLLNLTATKDWANTEATADITVGGTVIAAGVPVTYLMWLEKQLISLHTVIAKVPTLDPAQEWARNTAGVWATPVVQTHKSKKVPKNWVKAEATDKHPAQVEIFHEDVLVGYWNTIRTSGALPLARKATLLGRVEALQRAVKFAREAANELEVTDQDVGGPLFAYLLAV